MIEFIKAFVKVQASLHNAKKDALNPHFKSKYADLASCYEACRSVLAENGFCIIQQPYVGEDGSTMLRTHVYHISGQASSGEMLVCSKDVSPQVRGSALTYARRYSLVTMVGIATEDDDGQAATQGYAAPKALPLKPKLNSLTPGEFIVDFGPLKGKAIKDCGKEALEKALNWAIDKQAKPAFQEAALAYLDGEVSLELAGTTPVKNEKDEIPWPGDE